MLTVEEKGGLYVETSTIALIIVAVMLILYITEILPIATTSILAVLALAIFGVIPMTGRVIDGAFVPGAFSGFGNDIVYLIVGMIVVGNAVFESGVAEVMGKKIISLVGTNERIFMLALVPVTIAFSMFLSNTATAGIMLPIVASAVAASSGKLSKKNTFMMIGIIAVAGGGLTIVGSTPQQIALAYLNDSGHGTIGFWELSWTGAPILILAVIFFQTIGLKLQKKFFDFPEVDEGVPVPALNRAGEEKPKSVAKMWITVAILVFCVVGFITVDFDFAFWSLGVVAMVGAVACVATGCISQKRVFEKMDWTTVVIMGCSFGISAGIEQSGAGELVANTMINILGDRMTPWLLAAALALITMLLSNFMSSTACAALLIPIAGSLAMTLGYDIKSIVMVIAISANVAYATPVSTPPITMTLVGGYRFKDYVKVGGLFNLMAYILLILLFPLVLNF